MAAVPKAVNYLIEEVAEMRAVLLHIESQLGLGVDKHQPIKEERAVEILGITDRALKKMCEDLNIPRPSSAYWSTLSFGKKVFESKL